MVPSISNNSNPWLIELPSMPIFAGGSKNKHILGCAKVFDLECSEVAFADNDI